MALRRNSLLLAAMLAAGVTTPAPAEDYSVNYMSRRDSITIGLGDATTSNIIIQHPTPWPSYINNTDIPVPAGQGINALNNMMMQYMPGGSRTQYSDDGTVGTAGGSGVMSLSGSSGAAAAAAGAGSN